MVTEDIMTKEVLTVSPDTPVPVVAKTLVDHRISAVPVVDADGKVLGIVSEGDLLRRVELGTDKPRQRWLDLLAETGALAERYARSHGSRAQDIMTAPAITTSPGTPLAEAVDLMETHGIKRLLVTENGRLVGIVTRGNLVRALAMSPPPASPDKMDDQRIRSLLLSELHQLWGSRREVDVSVKKGVVHFWGAVYSDSEKRALQVAARAIPGVAEVRDHTFRPT